jgi:8-amino-7-oxononanoate synthase
VVHDDLYRQAYAAEPPDRQRRLPSTRLVNGALDFSSNDYLGLSRHAGIAATAARAARRYGNGATGSRLLSGNTALHEALERRIARDLGTEAALIFPSGYQMNAGVISTLLDSKVLGTEPVVFCDRLIHASLHHGTKLAGVRQRRFKHNNFDDLEQQLQNCTEPGAKFIITESLYSMDGDICDTARLTMLAEKYHALLCIDEAHAIGMYGINGRGFFDQGQSIPNHVVVLGTMSKALGGLGGYIACSAAIQKYLIQKCSGFIYTTALAPSLLAVAWHAWRLLPQLHKERALVHSLSLELRSGLDALGLSYAQSTSHIVPVLCGSDASTLQMREALRERGIIVSAIRPPTVPSGQSRLRITVGANHSSQNIQQLIAAIGECKT